MKTNIFSVPALFIVQFLTAVSLAWAIPHKDLEIAPEPEPFDLYFSEEKFVEVTSRYPKALSRIAENVSTITAAEIEAANVHTIAEILNRIPGMFVSFNGQDFGSEASLHIHGADSADNHHTLVLLDGVKYNRIANGTATTNGIPVGIIKRIEIVKGPASSTWGSALGGVINIITKDPRTEPPHRGVFASGGEAGTSDLRGEWSGTAAMLGSYLYAGKQRSDGLRDNRFFNNENFYGKFTADLPHASELLVTAGYTQPEIKYFDYSPYNLSARGNARDFFITANYSVAMTGSLNLSLSANTLSRSYTQNYTVLGTGDQFREYQWQEDNTGFEGRLVWAGDSQTVAFGCDYSRNTLDQRIVNGPFFLGRGMPPEAEADPAAEERWAIYLNDTFASGKTTVTPGLRYDWHSISDDFLSPSLGIVYKHREDLLFRGSVARGFSTPYLSLISGGGAMFNTINPELKPEQVWSVQGGLETAAFKFCRFKTTLFFHSLHDAWKRESGVIVNAGKSERTGYEIELDTIPIHDFSFSTNLTSVYVRTFSADENDHLYAVNAILRYGRPRNIQTELVGHYVWWPAGQTNNGRYDDFLWDLNISKKIPVRNFADVRVSCIVHNIFNGSQYWGEQAVNPDRWIESAINFSF